MTILISGKEDVSAKKKKYIRDKKEALCNDKGANFPENITIFKMYVPINTAWKYIRQKLVKLQGEID